MNATPSWETKFLKTLFSRMTVSRKLLFISISFSLPIMVLLGMLVVQINSSINFARWELSGNEYLRPLVELLDLIPQHELALKFAGPSRDQLPQLRSKIDNAFAALEAVNKTSGETLQFTAEGLAKRKREHVVPENVKREWQELKVGAEKLAPAALQEQHRHLVADLRMMITHVGDMSNLILDPDLDSYYLMDAT